MKKLINENRIKNQLKKLGFAPSEIDLFMYIASSNGGTIAEINRSTGIPRTTVSRNLKQLISKGLVSKYTKDGRSIYVGEDPSKITDVIKKNKSFHKEKLKEFSKLEDNLPNILKLLTSGFKDAKNNTKISVDYYEGQESFERVYKEILNTTNKEILFIGNYKEWKKSFDKKYNNNPLSHLRVKKGIKARTISVKSKEAIKSTHNDKKSLRETRFLPEDMNFNISIIIYTNNIAIRIASEPFSIIKIESYTIYTSFKSLFEHLWKQSSNSK